MSLLAGYWTVAKGRKAGGVCCGAGTILALSLGKRKGKGGVMRDEELDRIAEKCLADIGTLDDFTTSDEIAKAKAIIRAALTEALGEPREVVADKLHSLARTCNLSVSTCQDIENAALVLSAEASANKAHKLILAILPDTIRKSTWKTKELRESAAVLVTIAIDELIRDKAALSARADAQDGERYRWLREQKENLGVIFKDGDHTSGLWDVEDALEGAELDATIDAARQSGGGE
jgi:hypothetical protein